MDNEKDLHILDYPFKITVDKKENPEELIDRFKAILRKLGIKYYETRTKICIWQTIKFMNNWETIRNHLIH